MGRITTYEVSTTIDGKRQFCCAFDSPEYELRSAHTFAHTCSTYTTLRTTCDGGVRVWQYCEHPAAQAQLVRHVERIDAANAKALVDAEVRAQRRAVVLASFGMVEQ